MLTLTPPMLTPIEVIFLSGALKMRPKAYYRPGVGRAARKLRANRDAGFDKSVWDWWKSRI